MNNVVSLRSRDANRRLVWIEYDGTEGFRVRTNYSADIPAAAIRDKTGEDPHSDKGGASAALAAAALCHRDGARVAPHAEYANVVRQILVEQFGQGGAA